MKTHVLLLTLLLSLFALSATSQTKNRTKVIVETNKGRITLALYDETPIHRDNFLKLCREHYYDSLLFHRVISDFMIQGGDPDSRHTTPDALLGEGDPGYELPAEIVYPQYYHKRGAVAAARRGDDTNPERRSSGSQFYIVWGKTFSKSELKKFAKRIQKNTGGTYSMPEELYKPYMQLGGTPHLDAQYTVFGEVIEGLDIIDYIQKVATDENDRPYDDIIILSTQIIDEKE